MSSLEAFFDRVVSQLSGRERFNGCLSVTGGPFSGFNPTDTVSGTAFGWFKLRVIKTLLPIA